MTSDKQSNGRRTERRSNRSRIVVVTTVLLTPSRTVRNQDHICGEHHGGGSYPFKKRPISLRDIRRWSTTATVDILTIFYHFFLPLSFFVCLTGLFSQKSLHMLGRVAGRFPNEERSSVADARFCTVR